MALTAAGLTFIVNQIVNPSLSFNSNNAYIGVGDSTAAVLSSQTDLLGVNKVRRPMDTGYPQIVGNKIIFRATFPAASAAFTWNEWGIFNGASGGTMLVRKVEDNGTKKDNQEWVITCEVPFTGA